MTPDELVTKWAAIIAVDGWGGTPESEKHDDARENLRARVAIRALVTLLINKGVFTSAEWQTSQSNAAAHFDTVLTNRYPRSE